MDGCTAEPVAKTLCRKHYMRLRRTGSPDTVRKSGPKPAEYRRLINNLFSEWSPRTLARYQRAMLLLPTADLRNQAIQMATRPNGTVNVSRLLDVAETIFGEEQVMDDFEALTARSEAESVR